MSIKGNIAKALEMGLVPDPAIRQGIRYLLAKRLRQAYKGGIAAEREAFYRLVRQLRESTLAVATQESKDQHYEVPAAFYELSLGPNLKYSSAFYPQGSESLGDAERAMLELTVARAQLLDGQDILELGCGWGSLTLFMAARYPNSRITGVSHSASQRQYILAKAAEHGLRNVEIITADINVLQMDRKFDRLVSVEMFEHVRNYQQLFEKCASWLKPEALMFVHVFCHREIAYPFEVRGDEDWMAKYFFTGGMMPSEDLFLHFQDHLRIVQHWRVPGRHYGQTSEHWLQNLDRNHDKVLTIFQESYRESRTESLARLRRWRVFFLACAELFNYNHGRDWMVAHYTFQPR